MGNNPAGKLSKENIKPYSKAPSDEQVLTQPLAEDWQRDGSQKEKTLEFFTKATD